jgi:hypothetical protein
VWSASHTASEETTTASPQADLLAYGYTYGQPSGNRFAEGEGDLPDSRPVDEELGGESVWVVGVPLEGGTTAWVAALADGQIEAFRLDEAGEVERRPITPERLSPGTPPP